MVRVFFGLVLSALTIACGLSIHERGGSEVDHGGPTDFRATNSSRPSPNSQSPTIALATLAPGQNPFLQLNHFAASGSNVVFNVAVEKAAFDPYPKAGFPRTAFEYAKMVEPELGVPPRVDLGESVEIPIYVDGVQRYGDLGVSCDNPTLIGKGTMSGSTLQRYEGQTADGELLPDVVWVSFGRNGGVYGDQVYGSVQMIGYNKRTGATAFFESSDKIAPWVRLDEGTLRMRGVMPWIDEPEEFNRAFVPPGNTQCVACHQADPFITDSFINAAKIPGTEKNVVPILNQDSPYYVIGGENWDMRTIHIEGNGCFDCHRVGMSTVELFMGNGWDPNEHMPPFDPGSLEEDFRELLAAWIKGPEQVPGAEWIIPPARGQGRQVVGDDYPYKAEFNQRGKKSLKPDQSKVLQKERLKKPRLDDAIRN